MFILFTRSPWLREDRTTRPSGFYGFLTDHISRRRTTSQPLGVLSNKLANLHACTRVPRCDLTGASSVRVLAWTNSYGSRKKGSCCRRVGRNAAMELGQRIWRMYEENFGIN